MLTIKVISTPSYGNNYYIANGVNYISANSSNYPQANGYNYPVANGVNYISANSANYLSNNYNYVDNLLEEVFEAKSVEKKIDTVVACKPDGTKYEIRSGSVYVMNDYGQTVSKYVL